mgnify:CR=1 FL=1
MNALHFLGNYSKELDDWLGFLGVLQILLAYFLNVTGTLSTKAFMFKILNFSGALMAFFASYLLRFWPFMILEAVWYIISFINLVGLPKKSISTIETDLHELISNMNPHLNYGEFVFVSISDLYDIYKGDAIAGFKEEEGTTLILKKDKAMQLNLPFGTTMSWITLKVHSSLEAVGLTAAFSGELSKHGIACNVVAGYYHDHIFVDKKNAKMAVKLLKRLSNRNTVHID